MSKLSNPPEFHKVKFRGLGPGNFSNSSGENFGISNESEYSYKGGLCAGMRITIEEGSSV